MKSDGPTTRLLELLWAANKNIQTDRKKCGNVIPAGFSREYQGIQGNTPSPPVSHQTTIPAATKTHIPTLCIQCIQSKPESHAQNRKTIPLHLG